MKRRDLCSATLALPIAVHAQPTERTESDLADLLRQRLRLEGIGLVAARLLPDGRVQGAAAGPSRLGGEALLFDRHAFEIGSITKTFIGLLLADAVQRGELALDDALDASLPDGLRLRDRDGAPLRWVDVATHRSGLPRLPPGFAPKTLEDPYADFGDAQMVAALRAFVPLRRRDEAYEYSNLGYGLLGWLLARRRGRPLATLLEERVLAPLGLGGPQGMQLRLRTQPGPGFVQGHSADGRVSPPWQFDALAGAGALLATGAQLARYGQAMLGHFKHPLQEAVQLALKVHSPLGPAPNVQTGLAWLLAERGGQRLATHDGGTGGFASSLWLDLGRRRGALAMSNMQASITDLARHLLDADSPLRDIAAERREAAAVVAQPALRLEPEQLAPLAGVYALSPRFKLVLRVQGGQLFAQATGQGEFELFAKSPRQFFARVTALELSFEDGDPPPAFTLQQGGQRLRFVRE